MKPFRCPKCGSKHVKIYVFYYSSTSYEQEQDGFIDSGLDNELVLDQGRPTTGECCQCDYTWTMRMISRAADYKISIIHEEQRRKEAGCELPAVPSAAATG